jgi:hypothetical protein
MPDELFAVGPAKRTASLYERETDRNLISIELQVLIRKHFS